MDALSTLLLVNLCVHLCFQQCITDQLLPSWLPGCHIWNWTRGLRVVVGHKLSPEGFAVLSWDTDRLQGQGFLSSPALRSHFYRPVDKTRAAVWGGLLWTATHPSSICSSDVCTQQMHPQLGKTVCICGCHCSASRSVSTIQLIRFVHNLFL